MLINTDDLKKWLGYERTASCELIVAEARIAELEAAIREHKREPKPIRGNDLELYAVLQEQGGMSGPLDIHIAAMRRKQDDIAELKARIAELETEVKREREAVCTMITESNGFQSRIAELEAKRDQRMSDESHAIAATIVAANLQQANRIAEFEEALSWQGDNFNRLLLGKPLRNVDEMILALKRLLPPAEGE